MRGQTVTWVGPSYLQKLRNMTVFLGPIAGIVACDYWLVKKKHIDIPALYDPRGRYSYIHGVNWRAAVAFFLALPRDYRVLHKALVLAV